MEIILLKDLDKVGDKHTVVTVKDGYARNFLIPKGLALVANKPNMAKLQKIMQEEEAAVAARLAEFQEVAEKLKGQLLKIGAKAGQSGKIFGSVTSIQIANALKEQLGIEVERRKVELPEDIKTLGTYVARLNLHPEVDSTIEFEVVEE